MPGLVRQIQERGEGPGSAFVGVSMGKARQGRGDSSGLASFKNSGWLEATGVVSSCLVPGPGMI